MFLGDRHFFDVIGQGGIGLVVTFLFFFSVHPTVGSGIGRFGSSTHSVGGHAVGGLVCS